MHTSPRASRSKQRPSALATIDAHPHPREVLRQLKTIAHDDKGTYTFKRDVHRIKILDKKGKHTHTGIRCKHCGVLYEIPAEHKGRVECPSCGEDPERTLTLLDPPCMCETTTP
jgi:PHP family Zn ribbon phosphoesterase